MTKNPEQAIGPPYEFIGVPYFEHDCDNVQNTSIAFVIALGNKLDEMRARGEQDTEQYRILSDEWQALAHDLVVADILGDDE